MQANEGQNADIKFEDLPIFTIHPLITRPVQSCATSTPLRAYSPTVISEH